MRDNKHDTESTFVSRRRALADLYEPDETAWLEESSRLIRAGLLHELDFKNLASYLEDMARSERRQVVNRLEKLILHLLKWELQPDRRTNSWKATIEEQRRQLHRMLTRTLRKHAEDVLDKCYAGGVKLAALETGLAKQRFPANCPYTLGELLTSELP